MSQVPMRMNYVGERLADAARAERTADPGFGGVFTEHMVTTRWAPRREWHDLVLGPHQDLSVSPALSGLHYGQSVFEGLKAYRMRGDRVGVFRPEAHARRFQRSARRMLMPEPPKELFVDAVTELVRADLDWVPDNDDVSLYLRPILFGEDASLSVRASESYRLVVIACVVAGIFGRSPRPLRVWVSEDEARAAHGGAGGAKAAGNYAPTFRQQELARAHGCDQVLWLDPRGRGQIEELGAMNVFLVRAGSRPTLVTPSLSGSLLPGVTRDSVLSMAASLDLAVAEEQITLNQWSAGCRDATITEAFACGTAASIVPIGEVVTGGTTWTVGDGRPGPVTEALARTLSGIQRGALPDPHGWMREVAPRSVGALA